MCDVKVIIVAAGKGSRFGADCPKQFCFLNGRPVLMTSIDSFRSALPAAKIVTVISREMQSLWEDLCREHNFISPEICYGGATRWESVSNGLKLLEGSASEAVVLVHDAARPILPAGVIHRVINGATESDGAIPVVPVTDSLRMLTADGSQSVDRSLFRAVQTPQGFTYGKLAQAYNLPYSPLFTDDASVMEAAGFHNIVLVEGDIRCMKITNPHDIEIAELML
ncbi:MAG: 2-C-methyl-D-erythritol 4-phosphate cytidylyltransferase [Muribaculaceae bacterium]|nr:2-C-methyl-D-erythritol 4-phosphate cytidylyltransferase [Muribaculaceae bacterium]